MPAPDRSHKTPREAPPASGPVGHLGHPALRFKKGDRVRLINPELTESHRTGTVYKHIHDRFGSVKVLWDGNGATVVHEDRLRTSGTPEMRR